MTVPHFGRMLVAGALLCGLIACAKGNGGGGLFSGSSRDKAPQTIKLVGGRIRVEGPQGFCIDKATKLETNSGGFVVLGSCAAISGNPDDAVPRILAVLTISASPLENAGAATPDELKGFFGSSEGQAALAQSGLVEDAELLEISEADGVLFLQASDKSANRPDELEDEYWRGLLTLNDHLVSLTVTALKTYPFAEQTGQQLLHAFLASMKNANPEAENSGNGLRGLINRLL
ncbi:MAG: hypothetical protein GY945_06095 [Rhodobacteraceae bacterium]|nr:hypothetical protein [Paracoccaceae bacterium]